MSDTISIDEHKKVVLELTEAIRLTVEYAGTSLLPPVAGWSWYDALVKYAPKTAEYFRENNVERQKVQGLLDARGVGEMDGTAIHFHQSAADVNEPQEQHMPYEFSIVDEKLKLVLFEKTKTNSTGLNAVMEHMLKWNQMERRNFMMRLMRRGFNEYIANEFSDMPYSISVGRFDTES